VPILTNPHVAVGPANLVGSQGPPGATTPAPGGRGAAAVRVTNLGSVPVLLGTGDIVPPFWREAYRGDLFEGSLTAVTIPAASPIGVWSAIAVEWLSAAEAPPLPDPGAGVSLGPSGVQTQQLTMTASNPTLATVLPALVNGGQYQLWTIAGGISDNGVGAITGAFYSVAQLLQSPAWTVAANAARVGAPVFALTLGGLFLPPNASLLTALTNGVNGSTFVNATITYSQYGT
jgi:hypothetical protein